MWKSKAVPILAGAAVLLAISTALPTAGHATVACGVDSLLTQSNLPGLATGSFGDVCITVTSPNNATVTFTAGAGFCVR
jgi:hypothetical protein